MAVEIQRFEGDSHEDQIYPLKRNPNPNLRLKDGAEHEDWAKTHMANLEWEKGRMKNHEQRIGEAHESTMADLGVRSNARRSPSSTPIPTRSLKKQKT